MKKITIFLLTLTYTLSLQAQTPELCNETKNTVSITSTTTTVVDSTALPSTEIGNFTTGPPPPPPPGPYDQKMVLFLHGLAGSEGTWTRAATYSDSMFWLQPNSPTYPQEYTISTAFTSLNVKFSQLNTLFISNDNEFYERESTIVIAHSLGGVMTRYMDKKYANGEEQRQFGGFATFGSPHGGAPIIAALGTETEEGPLQKYLDKTCEVMTKPFVVELFNSVEDIIPGGVGTLFPLTTNIFLNNFHTKLSTFHANTCEEITNLTFTNLKNSIAPNIGKDIHPNSDLIVDLKNFVSPIPGLAFYGIEEAPVSWREIYSLYNNVNSHEWGEANEDDGFINQANDISDQLFMAYEYNNLHTIDIELPTMGLGDVIACVANGGVYNAATNVCEFEVEFTNPELADAYYEAWVWWNDFDRNYRIIFGHLVLEVEETGIAEYCYCYESQSDIDNGYHHISVSEGDCTLSEPDNIDNICIQKNIPIYTLVEKEYPGDGVMPAYLAKSFPGSNQSIEMLGSNHQQLRNDENTKKEFAKMYGGIEYGPRFYQFPK